MRNRSNCPSTAARTQRHREIGSAGLRVRALIFRLVALSEGVRASGGDPSAELRRFAAVADSVVSGLR